MWGNTVDWGSAPDWVASVGTAGAFLIASVAFARQASERKAAGEEKRRQELRDREAQGRLIMATAGSTGAETFEDTTRGVMWGVEVRVRNGSPLAVFDVVLRLNAVGTKVVHEFVEVGTVLPSGPNLDRGGHSTMRVRMPYAAPKNIGPTPIYYVTVWFTDANGVRWMKLNHELQEVDEDEPGPPEGFAVQA